MEYILLILFSVSALFSMVQESSTQQIINFDNYTKLELPDDIQEHLDQGVKNLLVRSVYKSVCPVKIYSLEKQERLLKILHEYRPVVTIFGRDASYYNDVKDLKINKLEPKISFSQSDDCLKVSLVKTPKPSFSVATLRTVKNSVLKTDLFWQDDAFFISEQATCIAGAENYQIACGGKNGKIELYDFSENINPSWVHSFRGAKSAIEAIGYTPNKKIIVARAQGDGTMLWDVNAENSKVKLEEIPGANDYVGDTEIVRSHAIKSRTASIVGSFGGYFDGHKLYEIPYGYIQGYDYSNWHENHGILLYILGLLSTIKGDDTCIAETEFTAQQAIPALQKSMLIDGFESEIRRSIFKYLEAKRLELENSKNA